MLHPRHARKAGEAGVTSFDVLTMGRIGVDLYPMQTGVGLEEVTTFGKWLGGHQQDWRGSVRKVRARGAAWLRRRRPVRHASARTAHAGDVLRDLPARRLPAVLLPLAKGARP